MNFAVPTLLAGMAALLIPLIIHLLNRSRHRRVQWGAMHLLQRVVRTNQRRLQVQQWILLLLRCAFPVLLALALAGPILTKFDLLPGDAPASTVILLDDSYSMAAGDAFEEAFSAVEAVLEAQPDGTEISLVTTGTRPRVIELVTKDRRRVRQQLLSLEPDGDPTRVEPAFDEAIRILTDSKRLRKSIVWISDFQAADWPDSIEFERLESPPAIAFFRVGQPSSENLAVESLELPPIALTIGQEIEIRGVIRNHGSTPVRGVSVFLRVNGDRVSASQVDLPADGPAEVEFERSFDQRGSHLVQIELDAQDSLAVDNRLAAAIEVPEKLPVLVIGRAADTYHLDAALRPFDLDSVGIEDLIETTVLNPAEFDQSRLYGQRAIVLSNVIGLSDLQLTIVEEFVRQGGGLIVIPGPDTDLIQANETLFPAIAPALSWERVLPPPSEPTRIIRERSSHPVFEIFNETDNGDPSVGSVATWVAIKGGDETHTLSRLASGAPMLIESTHLPGRVLVASTDFAKRWSDITDHPFFVPLTQRLVAYAATNTVPPRNVALGQPLVALLHPKTSGETLELTDPAGHTHEVTAEAEGALAKAVFPQTSRPGPYVLTNPHGEGPIRFSVASNRDESDLALLSDSQLSKLASQFDASVVATAAEFEAFDQAASHGTEIWKPILVFALLVLFADVFLAQRFVRKSARQPANTSGEQSVV
ncbi:MAG: hypothetical protein ACI8UO_002240 [Verrucomicrobiales bacterium]|jgi:hypothetical protein